MPPIYVSGHRNPDTDSIASAIGYAELKNQLDPGNTYVPVRLGSCNPQTQWVLERAGVGEPMFLAHVKPEVGDLMQTAFPCMRETDPIREAGLAIGHADYDLVPVTDPDGALLGVITTRALARQYVSEARSVSALGEPTYIHAVVDVLEGELVSGGDRQLTGRVWVQAMSLHAQPGIGRGDVVVTGDRPDAQRDVIGLGIALLVIANGAMPEREILELAASCEVAVVVTPLDTYVAARMITLAAPCRSLMETHPLVVALDDLAGEVSDLVKESHDGAAVVVDERSHPIGLLSRSDLVSPARRRVLLVDHAEQAQAVPGIEDAEIVEILDHHHIGSIETRVPVTATFDPVGSTATLVIERFRRSGIEPTNSTAVLLLAAVLSDTVILNGPTTTGRDTAAVEHLERTLGVDAKEFGREMFEAGSDVAGTPASELVRRDAKRYQGRGGGQFVIAQIEIVGGKLLDRRAELMAAIADERANQGLEVYALMVTDILEKGTELLVDGEVGAVARAFGAQPADGSLPLPGVMSRKKQVAPTLLSAL